MSATGPSAGAVPRLIWVTRTQPGAEATAGRLRAMGFDPLVAPLLEVRALDLDVNGGRQSEV